MSRDCFWSSPNSWIHFLHVGMSKWLILNHLMDSWIAEPFCLNGRCQLSSNMLQQKRVNRMTPPPLDRAFWSLYIYLYNSLYTWFNDDWQSSPPQTNRMEMNITSVLSEGKHMGFLLSLQSFHMGNHSNSQQLICCIAIKTLRGFHHLRHDTGEYINWISLKLHDTCRRDIEKTMWYIWATILLPNMASLKNCSCVFTHDDLPSSQKPEPGPESWFYLSLGTFIGKAFFWNRPCASGHVREVLAKGWTTIRSGCKSLWGEHTSIETFESVHWIFWNKHQSLTYEDSATHLSLLKEFEGEQL